MRVWSIAGERAGAWDRGGAGRRERWQREVRREQGVREGRGDDGESSRLREEQMEEDHGVGRCAAVGEGGSEDTGRHMGELRAIDGHRAPASNLPIFRLTAPRSSSAT